MAASQSAPSSFSGDDPSLAGSARPLGSAPSAVPSARAGSVHPADAASGARGFLQDLGAALHNLTTLKIVTVVGDVAVSGSGMSVTVAPQEGVSVEAASTELDMFNAQITNVFTPKFSALDGGALYKFHQAQVDASVKTFDQHIGMLKDLASYLLTARR